MVDTKHPFAPGVITRRQRQRRSWFVSAQIAVIYAASIVIAAGIVGVAWQEVSQFDFTPAANFVLALVPNI